jgi:CubicO group peptidase (beta-lactamase class C family)
MLNAANWTIRLRDLAAEARVTGAVLGIWHNGEEVRAACGVLNAGTGVPVTIDSLFQLGSITKLWTATMIMQLVDEGLLTLDTTVAEALPGVRLGVQPGRGAAASRITVRHLLTHTSGVDGDLFTDTGRGDDCVERYVDLLAGVPIVFPAGAAYSYSNSGYVLLGRIIEVLDGQSWDESLRARLAGPLALTKTVTLPEEAILHRAAAGHHGSGMPVQAWNLPRSVGPAALVTATVADLLTFARLHLDEGVAPDGKQLISEASVAAMQVPAATIPEPGVPGSATGLGWRLGQWDGHAIMGHDGDTIGQSAYLRVDPGAGVAACLLTNSAASQTLYQSLFGEVFGDLAGVTVPAVPGPLAAGTVPPAAYARHAGRYERTSRRFDLRVRDGQLLLMETLTGNLASLIESEPEELVLHPADISGCRFVARSREADPWAPVSFGELPDGTPYLFKGGRVTPRAPG